MNIKFKYIKLLLVIVISFLGIGDAVSQQFAYLIDGYWSNWEYKGVTAGGSLRNLVVFYSDEHPSIFELKWKADNYTKPSQKEIKEYIKKDAWFEYTGTVEYWVSEQYPTIKDALKKSGFLVTNPDSRIENFDFCGKKAKRTANAKMRCKFDETGDIVVISLIFDGIGYAISFKTLYR